jgi:hypothetical protein
MVVLRVHLTDARSAARNQLGSGSDKEHSSGSYPRRPADKGAGWNSSSASSSGKARSAGLSGGGRQAFRTTSLDPQASTRDSLVYKDEDDSRFNFGGNFNGGPPPSRTASLETGPRRDWEESTLRGLRLDRPAAAWRDAGGTRARPESARAASLRVSCGTGMPVPKSCQHTCAIAAGVHCVSSRLCGCRVPSKESSRPWHRGRLPAETPGSWRRHLAVLTWSSHGRPGWQT